MITQDTLEQLRSLYCKDTREKIETPDFPVILLLRRFWVDTRPLNKRLDDIELLINFLSPLSFPCFSPLEGKKILTGFYSYDMGQLAYLLKITPIQIHYLSTLALLDPANKLDVAILSEQPYYIQEGHKESGHKTKAPIIF